MPKKVEGHSFSGGDNCIICGMSRKAYDDAGLPCRGPYSVKPNTPEGLPTGRRIDKVPRK